MGSVSSIARVAPAEAARRLYQGQYYVGVVMATKAIHKLGDISREEPTPAAFHTEVEDAYIGNFREGFGFVDVRFPKSGCRLLTESELAELESGHIEVGCFR